MLNILETARLILRPWQANDLEELEQLWASPAVRQGRHLPPERIRAIAQSSLQQWQRNGFGPWAALDKATGQWIGRVGLDELDDWPEADKIVYINKGLQRRDVDTGANRQLLTVALTANVDTYSFGDTGQAQVYDVVAINLIYGNLRLVLDRNASGSVAALADLPDVDAVFAANDAHAIGFMSGLRKAGLLRDGPASAQPVAVIGLGDLEMGRLIAPALSTIRVHGDAIGRTAARLMLSREGARRVDLGFELVLRDSG